MRARPSPKLAKYILSALLPGSNGCLGSASVAPWGGSWARVEERSADRAWQGAMSSPQVSGVCALLVDCTLCSVSLAPLQRWSVQTWLVVYFQ